jgi:hypothetical protein
LVHFKARLDELKHIAPGAALSRLAPEHASAEPVREIDRVDRPKSIG